MELMRAYAILGVGDDSSLEDVRTAFVTWWYLYSGNPISEAPEVGHALNAEDWDDPASMLALHELDMAWHAIEQAHVRRQAHARRTPSCAECGTSPAVRVSFTKTKPRGLRARTETVSAVLCRACGMDKFHAVQGETLRKGWLAPLRNARVVNRNAAEARALREFELSAAEGAAPIDLSLAEPHRTPLAKRIAPWLTSLAAIALVVGIAMPSGSGEHPEKPGQTTVASKQ